MTEPDYVFDGPNIQEYWWEFRDETDISVGDRIRFETDRTTRKNPLEVVDKGKGVFILESKRGTQYYLSLTEIGHLEPLKLTIRKKPGYDSLGRVERLEVFKE